MRQKFYANFPVMLKKLKCGSGLLVAYEILGPFSTCWLPITNILVINERNSSNKFNRNYLENWKHFLEALLHFQEVYKILSNFLKKIPFRAQIFWKLLSLKKVVTSVAERSCFRTPSGSQCVKWPLKQLKSARSTFMLTFH